MSALGADISSCLILLLKVAQNKMSHRTNGNFSTISKDFSTKISGFKGETFST